MLQRIVGALLFFATLLNAQQANAKQSDVVKAAVQATSSQHKHHHHRRHHADLHAHVAKKQDPAAAPAAETTAAPAATETTAAPAAPAAADAAPAANATAPAANATETATAEAPAEEPKPLTPEQIMDQIKQLERLRADKLAAAGLALKEGKILVNGPLPTDFNSLFAEAVSEATGCKPADVVVLEAVPVPDPAAAAPAEPAATAAATPAQQPAPAPATAAEAAAPAAAPAPAEAAPTTPAPAFVQMAMYTSGLVQVTFRAPAAVVDDVLKQVRDEQSKLANGELQEFLVEKDPETSSEDIAQQDPQRIDVDTNMPFGHLEPFGREDTGHDLTEQSIRESDEMIDQIERAQQAEVKRSAFRALTRLRGAAITSFDGIARSKTSNIDEFGKVHKWRRTHPLHHLADEESDVSKWAFPDNADF